MPTVPHPWALTQQVQPVAAPAKAPVANSLVAYLPTTLVALRLTASSSQLVLRNFVAHDASTISESVSRIKGRLDKFTLVCNRGQDGA